MGEMGIKIFGSNIYFTADFHNPSPTISWSFKLKEINYKVIVWQYKEILYGNKKSY